MYAKLSITSCAFAIYAMCKTTTKKIYDLHASVGLHAGKWMNNDVHRVSLYSHKTSGTKSRKNKRATNGRRYFDRKKKNTTDVNSSRALSYYAPTARVCKSIGPNAISFNNYFRCAFIVDTYRSTIIRVHNGPRGRVTFSNAS